MSGPEVPYIFADTLMLSVSDIYICCCVGESLDDQACNTAIIAYLTCQRLLAVSWVLPGFRCPDPAV